MKPDNGFGFPLAVLTPDDKSKTKQKKKNVNRLVCCLFNGLPQNEQRFVRHLNGNKKDCRAVNLIWVTHSEARIHTLQNQQIDHGTKILKVDEKFIVMKEYPSIEMAAADNSVSSRWLKMVLKEKKQFKEFFYVYKTPPNLKDEEWKKIKDYPQYLVSNMGRVKNAKNGVLKKNFLMGHYLVVCLRKAKKTTIRTVHRFVSQAFCENPEDKPFVDHIDGKKTNNIWSNLRWVTDKENKANPVNTRNRAVVQMCPETGKTLGEFSTLSSAGKFVGAMLANIQMCCAGRQKTCKNFKWKYAE